MAPGGSSGGGAAELPGAIGATLCRGAQRQVVAVICAAAAHPMQSTAAPHLTRHRGRTAEIPGSCDGAPANPSGVTPNPSPRLPCVIACTGSCNLQHHGRTANIPCSCNGTPESPSGVTPTSSPRVPCVTSDTAAAAAKMSSHAAAPGVLQ